MPLVRLQDGGGLPGTALQAPTCHAGIQLVIGTDSRYGDPARSPFLSHLVVRPGAAQTCKEGGAVMKHLVLILGVVLALILLLASPAS